MKPILTKSSKSASTERVLYVEDEDDNWEVAHLRMGSSVQLVRARCDMEACDIVRKKGADLAAIMMDIQLSGSQLDGLQLTQLFRGNFPVELMPPYARDIPVFLTPIIFVTAYQAKFSEADLLAAGGDAVMPKPVNFAALNLALTRIFLTRMTDRRNK